MLSDKIRGIIALSTVLAGIGFLMLMSHGRIPGKKDELTPMGDIGLVGMPLCMFIFLIFVPGENEGPRNPMLP
jgi:hypothetical protein